MTSAPFAYLAEADAAAPLLRREHALDPFIRVSGSGGRLSATTVGGRVFDGEISRLGTSYRIRWRPAESPHWPAAPQLVVSGTPLTVTPLGDAVGVEDGGPVLGPTGPLHPPLRPAVPLETFGGPGPTSGPLIDGDGCVTGWVHSFQLGPHDAVYGGGENPGALNLRGQRRVGANAECIGAGQISATYINVPWFWSDAGWSVLSLYGGAVAFDAGASLASTFTIATRGACSDLVLATGTPIELMSEHTALTGRAAKVPDWAFGVWFGRCSYLTETQIHSVIDDLRAAECPVDVVHVDSVGRSNNAAGGFHMDWEVDRRRFPVGWGQRLKERDVRLSLWHNPYVVASSGGAEWMDSVVRDADGEPVTLNGVGGRHLVDFTSPSAVEKWRSHVATLVAEETVAALKTDFGEAVPADAVFADGTSGTDLRNTYSLLYQRASYEAAGSPVMFTRSGTTGAQRYPGHWVGDQPSTWQGFEAAVRSTLALSTSGFAVVGADVGGFWSPDTHRSWQDHPLATASDLLELSKEPGLFTADVPPELFLRWTQWGALTGLMRFHGTGVREPTAYPEPYRSHAIAAARLRRQLNPYLAEVAREATETGLPMCRVMPLVFPGSLEGRGADTQHSLGADVLVAPVLEPGGEWRCWVPPGEWTRWDGTAVAGGWFHTRLGLGEMPALLRRGSEVSRLISYPVG